MKMKLIALLIGATGIGMTACSKCKVCTKESAPEYRMCQKDYSSNTAYGLAVDAREADGYTCKNAL